MDDYLIYGANGYTGALIARLAAARGHRPVLGGRSEAAVAALGAELGLEHRAFGLDDPVVLDAALSGVTTVLNCAGPFAHTWRPMAQSCLRRKTHYLDVTGEIVVFEALARLGQAAEACGVMLMPGVGFDVVPSDCLAAHLKRRLPTATHLALAMQPLGQVSRGTATTMAENLHRGGAVRRDGRIVPVPACYRTRAIDLGRGPVVCMTIPWGDVSTAWFTTGIPNIEVYMAAPWPLRLFARLSRPVSGLFGTGPVQRWIKRRIHAGPPGPTDEQRARGRSLLWGEARDDRGARAVSRLRGPEGYTLTALTALAVVDAVLGGNARPGFHTPGGLFGPDFVLGVPGVEREDD